MNFEVRDLALIEYEKAWQLQQELLVARTQDQIPNTILVLEHPHVITLGRKSPELALVEEKKLNEWQEVPLFLVERGGEATNHGPGQIVIYPIFKIPTAMGPKQFLRVLEQSIIASLENFSLPAFTISGATGVWVKDCAGKDRKIASLGIAVRNNVTYHGLALNLSTNLSYFQKIKPCGFESNVMIDVHDLKTIPAQNMKQALIENIKAEFTAATSLYADRHQPC